MEVCIANAENVPEGCMLALTAGHSRRLAPLAAKQKFAFGAPAADVAACDGGAGLKLEVLTIQGSTRIDPARLAPGAAGVSEGAGKGYRLEVPLKLADGTMKVSLNVKPAAGPSSRVGRGSREAARLARMPSPDSGGEKQRLVPLDELAATSGDEAVAAKGGRHRHNVALEARSYLEENRILPFVEEMMRVLVKEKPEDPWGCITALFPKADERPKKKEPPVPEIEIPQPPDVYGMLPSIGTWLAPKPIQIGAKLASGLVSPKGGRRRSAMGATVMGSPVGSVAERRTFHPPAPKATFVSFVNVEFCLQYVDPEKLCANTALLPSLMAQVGEAVASVAGIDSSKVEVECGSGASVFAAKLRCTKAAEAEAVKESFDKDAKGFLRKVESSLRSVHGVGGILCDGAPTAALGARALRTFIRQKLAMPGDDRPTRLGATASTFAPTATATTFAAGTATRDSWYPSSPAVNDADGSGAAGVPEEFEAEQPLRDLEVPEAVCSSGTQVLRQLARKQFLEAAGSGELFKTLDARRKRVAADVLRQTKETLLLAVRQKVLGSVLHKAKEYRTNATEETRQTAKARVLAAAQDGSLEAALERAMGPPVMPPGASESTGEDRFVPAGRGMSKDELRAELKDLLLRKSHDKTLAASLTAWATERDRLLKTPRPLPIEPFGTYYTDCFKWMDAFDSKFLYASFERAAPQPPPKRKAGAPPELPGGKAAYAEPEPEDKASPLARIRAAKQPPTSPTSLAPFSSYMSKHFSKFSSALPEDKERVFVAPSKLEMPEDEVDIRPNSAETEEVAEAVAIEQAISVVATAGEDLISEPAVQAEEVELEPVVPAAPQYRSWRLMPSVGMMMMPRPVEDLDEPEDEPVPEPALAESGVAVNLKVENVDYNAMAANPEMLAQFERETRETLAREAGVPPECIVLDLSQGSIKICATIVPPAGVNVEQMSAQLQASETISESVVATVANIPNIATIAKGPIECKPPAVEQTDTKAAMAKAKKQVMDLVRKKRKDEREAAKMVEEEMKKKEEEMKKKQREDEEKQRIVDEELKKKEAEEAALSAEAARKMQEAEKLVREEQARRKKKAEEEAEEAQRQKETELAKVSEALQVFHTEDKGGEMLPPGAMTPPAMKPVSSSDFEELGVGDRVEVINGLYMEQDGMEVLAGWQGTVEEINDGDAVVTFYGMDEGRYVLREDFGNLIVMKADPSISDSSADVLANACSEAVHQNEQLRAQNAALRVELDRLLALATPVSTPPLTGASRYNLG